MTVVYRTPRTSVHACGVDSLYVCLKLAGASDVDLAKLETELPYGPNGVSFEQLGQACRKSGMRANALKLDSTSFTTLDQPTILHVNGNHYIALMESDEDKLVIFDNQIGLLECTRNWFNQNYQWQGAALVIGTPSPALAFSLYGKWLILALVGIPAVMVGLRQLLYNRKRITGLLVRSPQCMKKGETCP